jgi:uncharacterized protein YrrD
MQHRINTLTGYNIKATDGDLGKLREFYFDDETWTIRYLVVETGGHLFGRKVLISLFALGKPDEAARAFTVNLTKDQVKNSPDIDTDKPVDRHHETELHRYYEWPSYWESALGSSLGIAPLIGTTGTAPLPYVVTGDLSKPIPDLSEHPDNLHLRSTRRVTGYHLHALDGEIGHVTDFIVDDEDWLVRFLLVDIGKWLSGRKVLISPQWIESVAWDDSSVYLDITREAVKSSPKFDPSKPIPRDYEDDLHSHYGQTLGHY